MGEVCADLHGAHPGGAGMQKSSLSFGLCNADGDRQAEQSPGASYNAMSISLLLCELLALDTCIHSQIKNDTRNDRRQSPLLSRDVGQARPVHGCWTKKHAAQLSVIKGLTCDARRYWELWDQIPAVSLLQKGLMSLTLLYNSGLSCCGVAPQIQMLSLQE